MSFTFVDMIGYAASLVLMISFMIPNIRTLRLVNTLGCAIFVTYGFLLPEINWPIIITNVFIVGVNVYYLFIKRG